MTFIYRANRICWHYWELGPKGSSTLNLAGPVSAVTVPELELCTETRGQSSSSSAWQWPCWPTCHSSGVFVGFITPRLQRGSDSGGIPTARTRLPKATGSDDLVPVPTSLFR